VHRACTGASTRLAAALRRFAVPRKLLILLLPLLPLAAWAQTDEIQVYDAGIAEVGSFELTVHGNYTPDGLQRPAFPGGVVPDHSVNGAFEWAYGLADFWELGLYAPVYTMTNGGTVEVDGAKLRTLFVSPHARERAFFYGINFEYSLNLPHWEVTRTALEVRPIIGWHHGRWDFILNPIIDSNFMGLGRAHFAPAERIAYNVSERWAFGVEEYGDLGPLRSVEPWAEQSQSLFLVVDYTASTANSLELGAGKGLTPQTDSVVLKVIWNHNL
jgi:hypothetical protein